MDAVRLRGIPSHPSIIVSMFVEMSEPAPTISLDAALVVVDRFKTTNARLAADMHLDIALYVNVDRPASPV